MTDRSVTHATFALEHFYAVPPARVFDAWTDPAIKTRWFTGALDPAAAPMRVDFRVGGTEQAVTSADGLIVELADLSITVGGDVAFCHCLERCTRPATIGLAEIALARRA
jgi:hypothetical protein